MTIYPKKINKVPLDNIRVEDYVFHTEETNHQKSFIKSLPFHTTIQQTFVPLENIKNLSIIETELNMSIGYASMIIQNPGSINVCHKDQCFLLEEKTNKTKIRANIFLSDWILGQLIETESFTISRWEKFSAYIWDVNSWHFAINFSDVDKLTLQFSGYSNE